MDFCEAFMGEMKSRALTEAALLSAIAVIIALVAFYVPLVASFVGLLLPVPFILMVLRRGLRYALLGVAVTTLLASVLTSPLSSAVFMLMFAPVGVVIGYLLLRRVSTVRTVLAAFAVSLVAKAAGLYVIYAATGIMPFSLDMELLAAPLEESLALYRDVGVAEADLERSREIVTKMIETLSLLVPTLVMALATLDTMVSMFVAERVLKRLNMDGLVKLPPFSEWRFSILFPYMFGFSLIGLYWGETRELALLYQVALNGYIISTLVGLVQGLSLLHRLMDSARMSTVMRVFVYFLIFQVSFLLQMVAFTGLFDMMFDYRKRLDRRQ